MARVVFMGTPEFALPSLRGLLMTQELVAVVTQPDRPAGRSQRVRQSPVKRLALDAGIPVLQPRRLRGDESAMVALAATQADVFVVAAFGQILPQAVLDLPDKGVVNVHASLLPRWRGAAPIQAAIRAGDEHSGATIMLLEAGLDTGPILAKRAIALAADETGGTLHNKLATLGADLLMDTLPSWLRGEIAPQAQDSALATYAPQIKKHAGEIDWSQAAGEIERMARAYQPWPRAYTHWQGARLTIEAGGVLDGHAQPGLVIQRRGHIAIGTGEGLFCPAILQMPGKKRLPIGDFINGYPAFVGARLGQ
ncbi:MAG: methionyl-tRNA formyltransferase [Chloroflexi bacterium]|nr:methionyl-tRNA formyltransferase [Chloroflexota bacterium]MCY4248401.1 methionyl-tRNA formyltransferase [Chloroflexota bacterium]